MSSPGLIVEEMMAEFGKSSAAVRQRVGQAVAEVTIDILNQNESRFRRLEKEDTITLVVGTDAYRLPPDLRTLRPIFIQLDTDGDFAAEWEIVSTPEFYRRKGDAEYGGQNYAHVETRQSPTPGEYLVFDTASTAAGSCKIFYYRRPLAGDTDIIENTSAIKEGVRSKFPKFVEDAQSHAVQYERMKSGIKESPDTRTTGMVLKPGRRQQRTNRLMWKIGRGQ
jgi:hypothetical protein